VRLSGRPVQACHVTNPYHAVSVKAGPETVLPMLDSVFREMVPFLAAAAEQVRSLRRGPAGHLPRFAGPVQFPLVREAFSRQCVPCTLWMALRVLDVLAVVPPSQADPVRHRVKAMGGDAFPHLQIPRLNRVGVRAAVAE